MEADEAARSLQPGDPRRNFEMGSNPQVAWLMAKQAGFF
jgi:hypothetical protein